MKSSYPIISNIEISHNIFDMKIYAPDISSKAIAGQFVSIYVGDKSKLLPRPISICDIDHDKGEVRLVYRVMHDGSGTQIISHKKEGDLIDILGPLGNGYPQVDKDILIIGGGIGIPPMLMLSQNIQSDVQKYIILGYRDSDIFLYDDFKNLCHDDNIHLYVATEDGSIGTKGFVTDVMSQYDIKADIIMACGPKPMLKNIKDYAYINDKKCYISLEERMACGIGACLACITKTVDIDSHSQVYNKRICKDGPVFDAREVSL